MGKQEICEVLVGRAPGERSLGRQGRQGSNIKIDIREIGFIIIIIIIYFSFY
jgi:hypothetical protein